MICHVRHRPAFFGEGGLGPAVGKALADGLLGSALRVGLHMPEGRPADGGRDHDPKRHNRMAQKGLPDGGVAVQLDIVLRRLG